MSWRNSLLQFAARSRFKGLREWSTRRAGYPNEPLAIPDECTRVVFGGDINFDPTIRRMWNLGLHRVRSYTGQQSLSEKVRRKLWRKFVRPFLSPEYRSSIGDIEFDEFAIAEPARGLHRVRDVFAEGTRPAEVDWSKVASNWDYPFQKITPFLRNKDLVIVNLETPLSDHPRDSGLFKSDPHYAAAMKRAGITVANVSNNHIFDAGEEGFFDTLRHIREAGIVSLGVGNNLEETRAGTVLDANGTRFCFLAYTQFCNSRFASLAATQPGVLPLDRKLMAEDIARAKKKADLVIVSVHWGMENQPDVHPAQVDLAHALVEAGADCIIGHHPHVPHPIEVYRRSPIVYSLGNFIFAQRNHPSWTHNILCELIVKDKEIVGLLVYPITARGGALFQPEILGAPDSDAALNKLRIASLSFGTQLTISEGIGHIAVNPQKQRVAEFQKDFAVPQPSSL